ncbi:MAG TPA: hypothetical protein DCZ94_00380 [Lentisphaeria bacterium]|nr:MAG: hypothetical protein A2X48_18875 [Lentisphaerae bacterium GWF2_49_21]HBC85387.1 hypothetical protein [Lentisphaeria bacterium]
MPARRQRCVIKIMKIIKDIEFIPGGGERNRLDIYIPDGIETPAATILRIHGGAWRAYSKNDLHVAHRLIDHGFIFVSTNYRYSSQARFPAQLQDCKAAVRWMRANSAEYGIDPERIGVCGDSAGAHLACLLGVTGNTRHFDVGLNLDQRSDVQAVGAWYPPTDFLIWGKHFIDCGFSKETAASVFECIPAFLGRPIDVATENAKLASPMSYVHSGSAPFFLIHGKKDPVVPYLQSVVFADALEKAGVEAKMILIDDAVHGGPQFDADGNFMPLVEFFKRSLR